MPRQIMIFDKNVKLQQLFYSKKVLKSINMNLVFEPWKSGSSKPPNLLNTCNYIDFIEASVLVRSYEWTHTTQIIIGGSRI